MDRALEHVAIVGTMAAGGTAGGTPLVVRLDHPLFDSIVLAAPGELDRRAAPAAWAVQLKNAAGTTAGQPLVPIAAAAEGLDAALGGDSTYISVVQDAAGRHRFVRLSDATGSSGQHEGADRSCAFHEEAEVKGLAGVRLLYARPAGGSGGGMPAMLEGTPTAAAGVGTVVGGGMAGLISDDLAPHTSWTNYSVRARLLPAERSFVFGGLQHPTARLN